MDASLLSAINYRSNIGTIEVDEGQKIHVVGDIHGDSCLVSNLLVETMGVCSHAPNGKGLVWNSGCSDVVVFCGDLVDRTRSKDRYSRFDEDSDTCILNLLITLDQAAQTHRGRVVVIIGNHELMNFEKDRRYVSQMGFANPKRQRDLTHGSVWINKALKKCKFDNLFGAVKIRNVVMVHGGLCMDWVTAVAPLIPPPDPDSPLGPKVTHIALLNSCLHAWMKGGGSDVDLDRLKELYGVVLFKQSLNSTSNSPPTSTCSPFWCREFGGQLHPESVNATMTDVFKALGEKNPDTGIMFMGHTVQTEINNCGRAYRIDAGMSSAFVNQTSATGQGVDGSHEQPVRTPIQYYVITAPRADQPIVEDHIQKTINERIKSYRCETPICDQGGGSVALTTHPDNATRWGAMHAMHAMKDAYRVRKNAVNTVNTVQRRVVSGGHLDGGTDRGLSPIPNSVRDQPWLSSEIHQCGGAGVQQVREQYTAITRDLISGWAGVPSRGTGCVDLFNGQSW